MAALTRPISVSVKLNSFAGIDSNGFHKTRSWPPTNSRLSSMAFSSTASRARLSCTAQIARIDPTSARCAPRSGLQVQTLGVVQLQFHGFVLSENYGLCRAGACRDPGGVLHFNHSRPAVRT